MMNPIKFVSPCCGKPLDIKSLDEVALVLLPKFPGEEGDSYGWNTRCCQDILGSPSATPKEIINEQKAVYKASVKAAERELEAKISQMRESLSVQLDDFEHRHDPDIERIYVFAIYGENTETGEAVQNYRTGDREFKDEALSAFNSRCNELATLGYEEIAFSDKHNDSYLNRRTFKQGNNLRHVALWKQRVPSESYGPPYDHATATGMYDRY